ncbi:MAG: ferric reductase-like transmembrane domain-containing protein [Saprospiraceae bacterium]
MWNAIKKNYGWVIVTIMAALPLMGIFSNLNIEFSDGLQISLKQVVARGGRSTLNMLYHISGEFAIRWMVAVLTLTPFYIVFGVTNLFVRQAMGIATAVWSILHFVIFWAAEGMMETFTQVNYVAGLIAVLIFIPLMFTSNRKSMRKMLSKWKALHRFTYLAAGLSMLHIVLLDKTWIVYAVVLVLGFVLRVPSVRAKVESRWKQG